LLDADALGREAWRRFIASAEVAIAARGRFCAALSGGSTPRGCMNGRQRLRSAAGCPWQNAHLIWGDDP
jgi:6-phosphogluconolactonase/glucosamine-6-phosphate isomerase/deaminase